MTMPDVSRDAFSHIRRMHDSRFPHEIAAILPGEFFVSADPMIIYTVLGSCVSACIRDPVAGVGGMNHFMLPAPREHQSGDVWGGESTRYGSYAMESLINEILKRGGLRHRLEVKLFGGGKIYEGNIDIGANNATWALEYLKNEGFQAAKTDLGDVYPRKLYYFIDTGRVMMKKLQRVKNDTIVDREAQYQKQLAREQEASDVTLF